MRKNTKKSAAPKYTHLTPEDLGRIVAGAVDGVKPKIADDICEHFEVEESEDYPGTFFVGYSAPTWLAALTFAATMEVAAANRGYVATESAKWEDGLKTRGRRHVSVFVSAGDFYDENGKAIA